MAAVYGCECVWNYISACVRTTQLRGSPGTRKYILHICLVSYYAFSEAIPRNGYAWDSVLLNLLLLLRCVCFSSRRNKNYTKRERNYATSILPKSTNTGFRIDSNRITQAALQSPSQGIGQHMAASGCAYTEPISHRRVQQLIVNYQQH